MASNAEILAQLGKLAEMERAYGPIEQIEFTRLHYSPGKTPDFPAIFAAFKRLVKIEEAAKRFYWANRLEGEAKGAQLPRDRIIDAECATMSAVSELTAALKEPQ